MAKIEYTHPASEHFPASTETIEVRPWALAGSDQMPLYIGSGYNARASGTLWVEIVYSVEGAQVFYTRTLVQLDWHGGSTEELLEELEETARKGKGIFAVGDMLMLPESYISLAFRRYRGGSSSCDLRISADTGAVFGRSSPGMRSIDVTIPDIDRELGMGFMRALIEEIGLVREGRHPDPAGYPEGSSEWPLANQLNVRAYDQIAATYKEEYFENPRLVEAFEGWLERLPAGAQVLDAGCGHGHPVIGRLLERGLAVTGSDLSPEMLRQARERFPGASFVQRATTAIEDEGAFDGVCSFHSVLYMDPIDLLNSFHRLHRALKPGGLLFLYGYDGGPSWRGEPFGYRIKQWMWSWHYGMEEAAGLLEEHGRFEVLERCRVIADPEVEARVEAELEAERLREEEHYRQPPDLENLRPFLRKFIEMPPYSYVLVARRRG